MERQHKFLYPLAHKKANFGCRCSSAVECWPTVCEALGSIPSTSNNNKQITASPVNTKDLFNKNCNYNHM